MNQENPLARRNLSSPGLAPWSSKPTGAAQPAENISVIHRLRRLLRGKMLLAVVLGIIGAVIGAAIGYKSLKPEYRSDGLIEVRPMLASPLSTSQDQVMPMYGEYVQSQANIIMSQRVIQAAMSSDDWQAVGRGNSPKAMEKFIKSLDVSYVDGSFFIRVSFTDLDPHVAPIAVKAMIQAYMSIYGDVESKELRDKVNTVDTQRQAWMQQRRAKQDQILQTAKAYGTDDLTTLHSALVSEMVRLDSQLEQAQLALVTARAAAGNQATTQPSRQKRAWTDDQIARVDPQMARYVQNMETDQDQVAQLRAAGFGVNHPMMKKAMADLDAAKQRASQYAAEFRANNVGMQLTAQGMPLQGNSVAELQDEVNMLQSLYQEKKDAAAKVGNAFIQIRALQNDVAQLKDNIDHATKLIDQYDAELKMNLTGRIKVASLGSTPVTPAVDRRQQAGLLGFILGGTFPVGILLLIGAMDQRYQFSEDADTDGGGLNLLGILPNLPDLLNDPKQASVAAHCVHQVRTMLQLRMHADDANVFAVTSASPGDGKTSLTLALGLSFAASGSRTLLIDCDLIGSALSRRLGANSPLGILDAMADRKIAGFVTETEIDNLSVLPAGNCGMHQAGSFSPGPIRRIINDARSNYDIVLIDTGPVLGSIETSSVAANADAVVVVVSRGQQRPLVERSIAQLKLVGARVLGIVFNRAEATDFERSVSRFSLCSIRPGQEMTERKNGSERSRAYGPVAGAVATSFKPGKDYDRCRD